MLWVLRFDHVYHFDNIRVLEFSKQVNLSEDSLAVNFVLKNSVHLLDCHFLKYFVVEYVNTKSLP